MPTLSELQRNRPSFPSRTEMLACGEEVIADSRARLTPSQRVEQKLEARIIQAIAQSRLSDARLGAIRPRAK
jgi:hypothetical protein